MHCNAVNRGEKLVHRRDHSHLRALASRAKTLVVDAQAWIQADGNKHWHPERAPQTSVAEWYYAFSRILTFPGVMETGDDTDVTGERCHIAKSGWVSCLGKYCGGG